MTKIAQTFDAACYMLVKVLIGLSIVAFLWSLKQLHADRTSPPTPAVGGPELAPIPAQDAPETPAPSG